jgi:uncharacterized protein YbgA (DUF1722 family)/uncharacterized protein YbbK (DUF523 family)
MPDIIRIGVSACLLGNKVRYDGGHKHDRFITDTLGHFVEYVPVCPEVECGLPVPREAMRLVGDVEAPRLVTIQTRMDLTKQMTTWAEKRVKELEKETLCGFIFKSKSPSSGMERVKVFNEKGMPVKKGRGLFAAAFMKHFPLIPCEDDGRLHDPVLRENFIQRIFVFRSWRRILGRAISMKNLVDFHTRHKLLIMAHSVELYREMGRLVAGHPSMSTVERYENYEILLMKALALRATVKKDSNVLMHMMGYFKERLSSDEKQELLEIIELFQKGHYPLIVPLTLINHYVRKYGEPYLEKQVYLKPHPVELNLRNHV